jgi:hypothetical protein
MRSDVCCLLLLFVSSGLLSGCGGSQDANRPDRVPASGVVLYKGDPVEGATVVFAPQDHSHSAAARTGPDGRFQLRTFQPGDGAVPGNFKVTVTKIEVSSQGPPASDDEERPEPQQKWLLPQNYGSAESSGLTAPVTADGTNEFTFELTGEVTGGGAPPSAARTRRASQE